MRGKNGFICKKNYAKPDIIIKLHIDKFLQIFFIKRKAYIIHHRTNEQNIYEILEYDDDKNAPFTSILSNSVKFAIIYQIQGINIYVSELIALSTFFIPFLPSPALP